LSVPHLQRFDAVDAPPITAEQIRRRWVSFHKQIRLMSGTRFQRTVGRMLGEDTRRYAVARFFGRPLLRVVRALRKSTRPKEAVRATATHATAIFPINYRPQFINYEVVLPTMAFSHDRLAIIDVDENSASVADLINGVNELVHSTKADWIFLVDTSVDDDARHYAVATLLAHANDGDDVVFADEAGENPFTPLLKTPAVGPHTLLSYNQVGRPALLSATRLKTLGGFDPTAGWAFEHDYYLRLSEAGGQFHHVTRVLPGGRPLTQFSHERMDDDTVRVVESALRRRGWSGNVRAGELAGLAHWSPRPPEPSPSIDIIIPTRDRVDLVRQCIDAIESHTTYQNYDVIILDNDSVKPETLEYFAHTKYRVVKCPGPFNYAKIVNRGVAHSSADYVVTLNNDAVVRTPDWLEQLVALAALPDVGIVGACLLDTDGTREHEGIVIAPYPQHLRTGSNYPRRDHFALAVRDVAAVTGAVQMVERAFWEKLGGMDEDLRVVMNDVDLCLRAQMEDRYVVYTPHVQLTHHVGSSRGRLDPIEDRNRFLRRWGIFDTFQDPYFPDSLILLGEKMFYLLRDASPKSPGANL